MNGQGFALQSSTAGALFIRLANSLFQFWFAMHSRRSQCADAAPPAKLRLVRYLKLVKVFVISVLLAGVTQSRIVAAQQIDNSTTIRNIDAAVKWRVDHIAGYTDTEHYRVFHGTEQNPVAEMVVKTTYRPESGKDYQVLSHNGSALIYKLVLQPMLESEHDFNLPSKIGASYLTSANYDMQLKPGGPVEKDGRLCREVAISPKHRAPNRMIGTIWVDTGDFAIVRLEGVTSKSASFVASPAHVMRQYARFSGFSQATHARAESDSLFGKVVVTIDYEGYEIQSR